MTEQQARRMGFKPVSYWESGRVNTWRREMRRPVCNEYWSPQQPDRIERVVVYGSASTIHTWRKA